MRVRAKAKMQYHHRDCHWIMLCHFRGCSGFKIAFHKNQNYLCYRVLILGPFEPWLHFKQVAMRRGAAATSSNWRGTVCEGIGRFAVSFTSKRAPKMSKVALTAHAKTISMLNLGDKDTSAPRSCWIVWKIKSRHRPERQSGQNYCGQKGQQSHHVEYMWRLLLAQSVLASMFLRKDERTAIHRQTNKKATPRTSSLYKSIKGCRTSFFQTHPRLRNVILQDLADTPTQNQDN